MYSFARKLTTGVAAIAAVVGGMALAGPPASAAPEHPLVSASVGAQQSNSCQLANGITHVINLQFDNVHLTRDAAGIPSDLEQMPNLYNFLQQNGVVMANAHDVLVHTATNFISNQTGLYPDRTAITQSNSFNYYDSAGNTHPGVSFAYWTAPVYDYTGANADTNYNLQYTADRSNVPNSSNVNVPAPWVPYTRAGCNVGEIGMSNTVLENIATDIPTVFGVNSPQQAEATANPTKATADFVGYAVHCSAASSTCANGQTDALPDEPGGYTGYKALFGNAEIQPQISPSGPVTALNGTPITDAKGNAGFPGFDSETATNSLGYAAQMLENGVQVANVYLSDLHSDHTSASTGDLGPGSQTYEQQLSDYNTAFGQFLTRLANDGITPKNTLFAVTTDEGDHFSGSAATPAGCTGLNGNYCSYTTRSEVNVNLRGLLATQKSNTTPYAIHSDPAPALWLQGNPAPADPAVRTLARDISGLSIANPLTGATDKVATFMADPVEEKILHFVSSDAPRTPSLTLFSGEDEYIGGGAANCSLSCVYTSNGFAWNHGGIWPDMQNIWAGYVGPGISARGINTSVWTDQVDVRPTTLALTGLRDDYADDGRVLVEIAAPNALPQALRAHHNSVLQLGEAYKQLLGADGQFAEDTLAASTKGLASGSTASDGQYQATEAALAQLGSQRDQLADQIGSQLLGAAFGGKQINEQRAGAQLAQAHQLLQAAQTLASAG
ncbi:alkaline phosphatase family protein [Rathayibacter soli]|uniref:hypothetical protein n=1 Tax=Rathayibacter soli TaxID=3144168 RepID=UPI0027E5B4EC|nr:hypothetical protein [Glaciibacter superstes]